MTTLTAETHWEELCQEVDECPFEELTSPDFDLESEIGDMLADDPSEDSLSKSVSVAEPRSVYTILQTTQQQHIATALGSALHETLAKYSVKDTCVYAERCEKSSDRDRDKSSECGTRHLTEISEFWDGWFDDIEIDDEINSVDNETTKTEIPQTQQCKRTLKSSHSNVNADVLLKISPITTCVLKPLIIDVTSKSKREVTSLFLKTQGAKNSEFLSSGSSSDECESHDKSRKHSSKRTANKKRKLNIDTLAEKKAKAQRKKIAKNSHDFKEVFKMEQVLKIKSVEKDCEDEEIDIGDLTDTVPN